MAVPNTFAAATSAIPLANLDANFAYYDAAYSITGTAVTFAGSITLNTGTANGIPYLNASKVLTSGSALTFDGTTFTLPRLGQSSSGNYGYFNTTGAGNGFLSFQYNGSEIGEIGQGSGIISGGSNTDFGIRATNNLVFGISYNEQMRLTSTGLGVGTSSFSGYRLNVVAAFASGLGGAYVEAGEFNKPVLILNHTNASVSANLFQVQKAGSGVMTLDASGRLGVGTTSPDTGSGAKLTVKGIYVDEGGSDAGYGWQIVSTSSGASPLQMIAPAITFSTGANLGRSERARIDASGNLLVGTTVTDPIGSRVNGFAWFQPTPALRIRTTGTQVNLAIAGTSGTNIQFFTDNGSAAVAAGNITSNGTATSYNTSSDYRLKNITGPITTSGAYIDSLKPVEGTWKADGSTFVGLIAHETQEASRTPVATGTKDGDEMQGMDYSSAEIIANLIAEIQDLRARVSALEPTGFVQSLFS